MGRWVLTGLLLLVCGCGDKASTGSSDSGNVADADTDADTDADADTDIAGGVIDLLTRDGIDLEADYYPAASAGRPGVVLLHMTPVAYDRTSWQADFIDTLNGEDWSVIVPDRRGAGGSGGVAEDAFFGEYGRYDVEAAVLKLQEDGAGALGIVGASNGTTSMIDYADWADGEGLPVPVVLGFLSGGSYTENNTSMDTVTAPAFFAYPSSEASWNEVQVARDPGTWSFEEVAGSDHGTWMFDTYPALMGTVRDFFAGHLE
jgi:pimeloyl-ACP methyl ester carboxylesterase